jgi:glutamyl-tRNA reductase
MSLIILGLSHKTAPLQVREKVVFDEGNLPGALAGLAAHPDVTEAMILSTCNRTEIYCYADDLTQSSLIKWLAAFKGIETDIILKHMYSLTNQDAVKHLLRVASGLDSLVIGEPQILGQLKNAYRAAFEAGTLGKFLNRLLQFSFSSAKETRTETKINNSPVSIAYAAVKLSQQIHGELSKKTAILVGAGETISLVANHLASAGLQNLIVANRSFSKASALASKYSGEAITLSLLPNRLHEADIVVSCTASRLPIITTKSVQLSLKKRGGTPIFIVDLAVPRDVESEVGHLHNAFLYTVDDFESVISENLLLRQDAAAIGEEIIHMQVQEYMEWLGSQAATETIKEFREYAQKIKEETLKQAHSALNNKDAREVLDQLATNLMNKLIHRPTVALRDANLQNETLKLAREILGLSKS